MAMVNGMTDDDPAATLQALADHFRLGAALSDGALWLALAEHVEGAKQRLETRRALAATVVNGEVRELLAVAAAAGVKP
jgi:hypothetical protein